MKKTIIGCFAALLFLLFFTGIVLILKSNNQSTTMEDNMAIEVKDNNTYDYFNGKILEITEKYLYVEPTEDWEWQEVSRVKLPLKKNFDTSEWKLGDIVRVPFNSNSMEWGEEEVFISIIFQIYNLSES